MARSIAAGVVFVVACSRQPPPPAPPPPVVDAAPDVVTPVAIQDAAPPDLPPLEAASWLIDLGDAKKKLGVLAPPLGARTRRPLMIALHGGSDRPEWACNAWARIAGGFPILVCPRGIGGDSALAWSTPADTRARVKAAVDATKELYAKWINDEVPIVLVGFSMGATQAALLAQNDPKTYRRVALAESAYAPEPVMAFAKPWAEGGGERVIFLCTTPGCEGPYRNAAKNAAKQHVPARLNIAGTKDHGMWNDVVQSMKRDWGFLIEGAPGWEAAPKSEEEGLPGKTEVFEAK